MPTTAADVAEYILSTKGRMDTMKLQKLVYYSQAWSLAWTSAALFEDEIQAWANGPVVRSLFNAHRGRYTVGPGDVGGNAAALDSKQKAIVDIVTNHYGKWTGQQLSEIAHGERPWINARKGLGPTERGNAVIDPTEMQDFYSALGRSA